MHLARVHRFCSFPPGVQTSWAAKVSDVIDCRPKPSSSGGLLSLPRSRWDEMPSGILNNREIQKRRNPYMNRRALRPAMLMQIDRQMSLLLDWPVP